MSTKFRFFVFVIIVSASTQVFGQVAKENEALLKSQPNGCGSGWSTHIVPDSIPLFKCSFRVACNGHDNCYGRCEGKANDPKAPECEYLRCRKGGDLYGADTCKTDIKLSRLLGAAQGRKRKCDADIGKAILDNNAGKAVCEAFAYVFENAVALFGDGYFVGVDLMERPIGQSVEDYNEAIRELFRHGTDPEFDAFNKSPPEFQRPLAYVKGKGLINIEK